MRKYHKKQCIELLNSIEEAHRQIAKALQKKNFEEVSSLLEDCQQAAIQVGTTIDNLEGEGTEAVHILEDYCEQVYGVHEKLFTEEKINEKQLEKKFRKIITKAKNSIRNGLTTQYEAVFLPYKASMWDSLESIWMAADEDPNCDAYVIPIPYYDKNPDGSFAHLHYEGMDFPDYVPVTDYADYNIEERHPDMVYIHNPYDDWNYVTSVHPNFFSNVLKKNTDCLVYVPYFATSGKMGEGQSYCPAYENADNIVVQSRAMIEQYDKRIPREKFLPLGSPKFDRVIRLCKNPPEATEDWKKKMEGRRVYFYNTSLAGMLSDTGQFLKKIAYVFNTFQGNKNACILWRPHPLLESTFASMRSEYRFVYDMIRDEYIQEKIGIYDVTPDIEVSIAHSDIYIGDSATSVTSLFAAAGKPIFILDNAINEKPPEDWWKGRYYYFLDLDSRRNNYVVMPDNKLFYMPEEGDNYRFLCDLSGEGEEQHYSSSLTVGEKTYLFPFSEQEILILSDNDIKGAIKLRQHGKLKRAFSHIWVFEQYVFLTPKEYPGMVRFNITNEKVDYVDGIASFCWHKDGSFCGQAFDDNNRNVIFFDDKANTILEVNIDTLEKKTTKIGYNNELFVAAVEDVNDVKYIWLIPREGVRVARLDIVTKKYVEYDLHIEGLKALIPEDQSETDLYYFGGVIPLPDGRIVFCPHLGNKFVCLNLNDGKAEEWTPPFPFYTGHKNQYYYNWRRGCIIRLIGTKDVRWCNEPEKIAYDLDLYNHQATSIKCEFEKEDIYEQYGVGFPENIKDDGKLYCCVETPWNPLENIIGDKIYGNQYDKMMQKKYFVKMNNNADGTCGKVIFERLLQRGV